MDSSLVRGARRRRLAAMLLVLEERGGDELAVLEGVADGMVSGLDSHGPLDLEAGRDWDREIDQEERDRLFYGACKREADRRARANAILEQPDEDEVLDLVVPLPFDGAELVTELEQHRAKHKLEADAPVAASRPVPPNALGRARRPSAGSLSDLGSVLEEVAGGDGGSEGATPR